MVDGCLTGATRAMYVVGENPLLSEPDLHHAEKALEQLDFLLVQDLFLHETAERAHVFLPAAAFAEKEGTFTNSERRVQRVRAAVPPPGEARPDWWITAELAKRVARRVGVDVGVQFDYPGAAEIFDEMARLTPFLAGLSHARLDREGGLLGVDDGARLRVESRRGELTGYARVTEAVKAGAIFVPFVKLGESAANFLTNAAFDPSSKIPEYKVCAVRVTRA